MTELLTPKTERVKKRELSLPHKVAAWAQVALMAWMLSWGNPQLKYVAVGTSQIDCAIAQPKGIAAGEPSGCERIKVVDPEIEFLDLGVTVKSGATSTRYWKIQGPDLNGIYGGLQGTGGLEAIYNQSAGTTKTILSDTYGHVEGALTGSTFVWNNYLFDGYGTLPSSSASVPLTSSNDLASVLGWRGKSIDPTGYYYLGARYYVPDSGAFLSPDPLGHAASWDLYSYCNGDPVNHFDADGRFGKGAATGVVLGGFGQYDNNTQRIAGMVGQIGSYFVPGLDGYAVARAG